MGAVSIAGCRPQVGALASGGPRYIGPGLHSGCLREKNTTSCGSVAHALSYGQWLAMGSQRGRRGKESSFRSGAGMGMQQRGGEE